MSTFVNVQVNVCAHYSLFYSYNIQDMLDEALTVVPETDSKL